MNSAADQEDAQAEWEIKSLPVQRQGVKNEIKARNNELYKRLKGKQVGDFILAYEHEIAGWEFEFSDLGLSFE